MSSSASSPYELASRAAMGIALGLGSAWFNRDEETGENMVSGALLGSIAGAAAVAFRDQILKSCAETLEYTAKYLKGDRSGEPYFTATRITVSGGMGVIGYQLAGRVGAMMGAIAGNSLVNNAEALKKSCIGYLKDAAKLLGDKEVKPTYQLHPLLQIKDSIQTSYEAKKEAWIAVRVSKGELRADVENNWKSSPGEAKKLLLSLVLEKTFANPEYRGALLSYVAGSSSETLDKKADKEPLVKMDEVYLEVKKELLKKSLIQFSLNETLDKEISFHGVKGKTIQELFSSYRIAQRQNMQRQRLVAGAVFSEEQFKQMEASESTPLLCTLGTHSFDPGLKADGGRYTCKEAAFNYVLHYVFFNSAKLQSKLLSEKGEVECLEKEFEGMLVRPFVQNVYAALVTEQKRAPFAEPDATDDYVDGVPPAAAAAGRASTRIADPRRELEEAFRRAAASGAAASRASTRMADPERTAFRSVEAARGHMPSAAPSSSIDPRVLEQVLRQIAAARAGKSN